MAGPGDYGKLSYKNVLSFHNTELPVQGKMALENRRGTTQYSQHYCGCGANRDTYDPSSITYSFAKLGLNSASEKGTFRST